MREVNASEEQEQESSEWNVRELSGSEFDELSAASRYGGFQQTSEMAVLAQSDGMQTQYVGLVDSHDAPVAGALVAFSQGRFGVEGSLWLGPLCNGNNREQMTALTEGLREAAERVHAISLTCWPNQVYCVRDSQGKAMAEPNDEMVREYERLGLEACWLYPWIRCPDEPLELRQGLERVLERRRAARFVCEEHAS